MPKDSSKNTSTALSLVAIVVGMVLLSYASVPLYRIFCQITGYGGTTQAATALPDKIYDREINVRFNAITYEGLPWKFEAPKDTIRMKVGEHKLAFFTAKNNSDKPAAGTATYNVTPHKVGEYFAKIDCFCFEEQMLQPSEEMEFPVSFYIDPEILNDDDADEVTTITLSYTFFPLKD